MTKKVKRNPNSPASKRDDANFYALPLPVPV